MLYKGYELMKAVSEGELNLKQKVSTISSDYKKCTIEFILREPSFNIMCLDFELIEDEVDIDSITENEWMTTSERNFKINQLVQAVKQLNKKVKELEDRK